MQLADRNTNTSPSTIRQLAAIMFTDMVGYTALMQDDEEKAKTFRDRQRQVLEKSIAEHQGKILQYYGDGTLSLFGSAIEAVKCAVKIQQELQQEPKVPLRIGLHSGDVAYDEQGIYGDCVNVASRIETLSVPGGVLISDKVFDEIKNHSTFKTQSLGKFNLKNVKRPVEVYAVVNEGLVLPTAAQLNIKAGTEKSIAVLPFVNMSADPENEYFSDGISEEILNVLTRVEGLKVTARTSSFFFKGKNEDIRQIGAKLGVTTVLEGSVRKAGKKVRITAQLINTSDGYHLWSETYDRDLEDIFEVQDEISLKIVDRMKENFAVEERKEHIVIQPTENLEAYNLYLKGRFHLNKSNPDEIRKAITLFEDVIRLDPDFALPYCALSYCYSFLGSSGLLLPAEAYPKAKGYSMKAIELDPNHPESHLALATIKLFNNWDFDGAEESLNTALELNLNSSLVNQIHGWFLIAKGECNKAIEKLETAVSLDPLSLPLICNLAAALMFASRYEEALVHYDKVIEMDPNFRMAYEGKGTIYLALKDYDKSIEYYQKYHSLIGNPYKGLSGLGCAYASSGQTAKAHEIIAKMKEREQMEPGVSLYMDYAFVYTGLGDYDKVCDLLTKMYEQRMGIACLGMIFCVRFPAMEELHSTPRFGELMDKIGLTITTSCKDQ